MATKFEFLPRTNRRLPLDWRVPGLFALLFVISIWLSWSIQGSSLELKNRFDSEIEAIETRRRSQVAETWKLIPDPGLVATVYQAIERHNFALVGPQPLWSELFQILEEDFPQTAVISKIENLRSGTSVFAVGENEFKLLVVVTDNDTSNQLFNKLSARKELQALSFMPKGETAHQGRKGIGIEVTFRLEKAS